MSARPTQKMDATAVPSLVGTVLAGRYRVDCLLGEGGMGRVYLAEHVLMRKQVALKVLHPELTTVPDVVTRFEREAVAAARIDHPSVAQALDCGRLEDGSLYFALEYVAGRTLRAVLDDGPIAQLRTLSIVRQVASAMAAAHAVGIVHRDLKPDNVMLVPQPDGSDRVKVLDFGIAKVSSDGVSGAPAHTLTRIGVVMGTAGYMSPEQALGQTVDHHADLYAFGAMLYEMLAGRLPFEAEEVAQLLAKQLTEEPAPLPPEVPPELAELVHGLLAKTASERAPATAAELVERLDLLTERRAVGGAPTAFMDAPPPSVVRASSEAQPAASARVAVARTQQEPAVSRFPTRFAAAAAVVVLAGVAVARWRGAPSTSESAPAGSAEVPSAVESVKAADETPKPAAATEESRPARGEGPGRGTVEQAAAPVKTSTPERGAVDTESTTREHGVVATESTTRDRGGVTRTRKTKQSREEHTVKRTKRHTGPGGIYIPPPSKWF